MTARLSRNALLVSADHSLPFFFFQAEDGIRDYKVTGVQTCALPIWLGAPDPRSVMSRSAPHAMAIGSRRWPARSEERRVGKECSSRRATLECTCGAIKETKINTSSVLDVTSGGVSLYVPDSI